MYVKKVNNGLLTRGDKSVHFNKHFPMVSQIPRSIPLIELRRHKYANGGATSIASVVHVDTEI